MEPTLGSQREELHQGRGLPTGPGPCGYRPVFDGDFETTEQFHAYRCHDPALPGPLVGALTTSCTGTIVAWNGLAPSTSLLHEGSILSPSSQAAPSVP